jgi:hypothetical protein
MSLLHHDDLEPGHEYRWYELKIRVLVPKDQHPSGGWYHSDTTMTKPIGSAGRCENCGKVTIETEGYPWGQEDYAYGSKTSYCPHCDGAEDIE